MALKLVLHDIKYYGSDKAEDLTTNNVILMSDVQTATLWLTSKNDTHHRYVLSLVDISFQKKMYHPTEVTAKIMFSPWQEGLEVDDWDILPRKNIEDIFKHKKVALYDVSEVNGLFFKRVIGEDFYIHKVLPTFHPDALTVTLKIYSLDKLLTLNRTSRTFVRKKLKADILTTEMSKYVIPYSTSEEKGSDTSENKSTVDFDADNMHVLRYTTASNKVYEHIFPYLVQYNESFYDLLCRTANRWGEFLFYENGKLNIGYNAKQKVTVIKDGFYDINYCDLNSKTLGIGTDGEYDYAGTDEDDILDCTLKKSPNELSGLMYWPNGKFDKVVMKKFSSFFKNEKSLPTFIASEIFNDSLELACQKIKVNYDNNEFDDTHFPDKEKPGLDEQYGQYNFGTTEKEDMGDGYNLFSEINSCYNAEKYREIVGKELKSGQQAITIDFDTTCPDLVLGQIISLYGDEFIVVEITCESKQDELQFMVTAVGKQDGGFYPTIIPSGHVRHADPQVATITDNDDPDGRNRVRVMFGWQQIEWEDQKNKLKGAKETTKAASSPWLTFTTNGAGSPTVGKHYLGNNVLVGFIDGNVERPYVLGGINTNGGGDADVVHTTPGGHKFELKDDQSGLTSFLTGMFLPGWGTLSKFIPQMGALDHTGITKSPALGGGFVLSDNYGIYKIEGSTDGREVSIASSWGDVKINAFTGISISAPNGDVEIKGKNVSIVAGNNLEIVSGTNVKHKLMGGSTSGFFADVTVAVTKKLAEMALSLVTVDLSIVRSVFEIAFRPTEGKLLVKSNRYLMLESGKGECNYPAPAYKSQAVIDKILKEQEKNELRPGLELSSGVKELISKVNSIGDEISNKFASRYNRCVSLQKEFTAKLQNKAYIRWANNYDPSGQTKICNNYADLKDKFWADGKTLLKEADFGFDTNYKATADGVDPKVFIEHDKAYYRQRRESPDKKKERIAKLRAKRRNNITKSANELRKAIIDLKESQVYDEDYIKSYLVLKNVEVPKAFMSAFVNAFKKENVQDTVYYKPFTDDQKQLVEGYDQAGSAKSLANDKAYLKRKVAVLMLEEMGFKDEWRKKIPDPAWVAANPLLPVAQAPKVLEVARDLSEEKLTNQVDWENYVNSIVAVPQLSADQWKVTQELKKMGKGWKDQWKFFSVISENRSWGDNKNGGILFSSDENIYNLNSNIEEVAAVAKEKLTTDDDSANDTSVATFLNSVQNKLKGLN